MRCFVVARFLLTSALLGSSAIAELLVFTARRYVNAVYAVVMFMSVCQSHSGIVSKPLNVG